MTAALSSGSAGTQDKCLGGHSVRNVSTWQLSRATVEPCSKPLLIDDYNGIIVTNQYVGDYSNPKFKVNSFRWLPFFPVLSRHFAGPP